ncbi:MAG: ABC transporter six-transmembrane domain-containing protein [Pseudomonadota bacterium]
MTDAVFGPSERLSLATIIWSFPGRIAATWSLVLVETVLFALLPLLIGWSIDGLLADDWEAFAFFVVALASLLGVSIAWRVYDTRAYGTIRVELGKALARRGESQTVSVVTARVEMGRELVDFLEITAPETLAAFVQVAVSILVLFLFHSTLAMSAGGAAIAIILIYAGFAGLFYSINSDLNARRERQVTTLESGSLRAVSAHFLGLKRAEIRLSDAESLVYGLIFLVLLSMLAFNLWFAAVQSGASPGQIFSIVSYSYELVQASVVLPAALQALTRLEEITVRINTAHSS